MQYVVGNLSHAGVARSVYELAVHLLELRLGALALGDIALELRIRFEQLLGGELHRAFHQVAINREFRIRSVDRSQEAFPLGRDVEVIAKESF